ncbi:hypothetical protein L1987_22736 [Smallanthus sonchifolius]|uniref:Uncharacterized protein n=1 Tax=Smallanthus sonchifolius TaxID=185202 RepID=A0ACB9IH47_9ASTR|nr:hypothetical protein L1987_22736 [Smallanthus sonchifolius]
MKGRFCRFVVIMICIMGVISRPLGPNHSPPTFVPTKQGTKTQIISSQFSMPSKSVPNSRFSTKDEDMMKSEVERYGRGIENRIGSRPPSCEHKCYGCSPCEATQVPTTSHVGIQYTNYEPEGWKCKCGPTFYSP